MPNIDSCDLFYHSNYFEITDMIKNRMTTEGKTEVLISCEASNPLTISITGSIVSGHVRHLTETCKLKLAYYFM